MKESQNRFKLLVFVLLTAIFVNPIPAAAGLLEIIPVLEDTYVSKDVPDANYGSENGVRTYTDGTQSERSYLKFDLTGLPDNQIITNATLHLDPTFVTLDNPVICAHYLESDDWLESTITWNNAPTNFDYTPMDSQIPNIEDETIWTVTNGANLSYSSDGVFSIVCKVDIEGLTHHGASFSSRESFSGAPYLNVEYEPIPEPSSIFLFTIAGLILRKRSSSK